MTQPSDADQIRFLTNLQRILDEGQFTATYKYALLLAIADICVREGDDTSSELTIATEELAEEFVRLYWHQARPFAGAGILRQNKGAQAAVISRIIEKQGTAEPAPLNIAAHRDRHGWRGLVRGVEQVVRVMPLTKLQTVGRQQLDFLYSVAEDNRHITLRPGVAFGFRRFYGIVQDLVRGAWLTFVRQNNTSALGSATELSEFLFPGSRASLKKYRLILRDVQQGDCLYCRRQIRSTVEVDHFVPWSRYPADIGENLVLAHKSCNLAKSSHLAAEEHLGAWTLRNADHAQELRTRLGELTLPSDLAAAQRIAAWAYGLAEHARGQLWVAGRELRSISPYWREALRA